PRELGQAAWRTLSQLVSNLFTSNSGTGPVLSDGYNLFDATNHKNLRTAALSAPEWDAVIQAVYKQTEPTSNKRLGVRPKYLLVPIELEKTALQIMFSEGEPATANNEANVRRGSAEVIVVPEWTDANDWAAACDPSEVEGVCIGHRFGKEPELFIADEPAIGSMFTNDEMRIKCRFIVAVGIGDYRALHKNNVA
ncbi:MAG: Mu-like prophage major head subunit gpT family protein, partial [Anaerolineae bacterium]|nr:Mu-like prophage major head subunit gpT family protein [Anaerolineae bacterium]